MPVLADNNSTKDHSLERDKKSYILQGKLRKISLKNTLYSPNINFHLKKLHCNFTNMCGRPSELSIQRLRNTTSLDPTFISRGNAHASG